MTISNRELPARLQETHAILATTDIQRATRVSEEINDRKHFVLFLDDYYQLVSTAFREHGGEIVKYMGDGALGLFPPDDPLQALAAIQAVSDGMPELCKRFDITPTDIKAALHIGDVIKGGLGPEGYQDVLGQAVNVLFQIEGRGQVAISETLYRKLPSAQRGPWRKQSAPTIYIRDR